jgi:integrase
MTAKLSSYCKPASVRFALKTFSTALNAAVEAGYIEANPARKVKRPKNRRTIRALSQEEAARLMAVVKPEERAYYDVAMKLGLRQGELAALKWENVDLLNRTLMVEATVDTLTAGERWGYTKNSEARTITFGQRTKALLEKLPRTSELVFPGPNGKAIRRSSVLYRFKRYLKEAKLPNIRFHDLRHTCATLGLRSGIAVHVVSKMLGHSDPGFTLRVYSHVLSDMYGDAADKMDGYRF